MGKRIPVSCIRRQGIGSPIIVPTSGFRNPRDRASPLHFVSKPSGTRHRHGGGCTDVPGSHRHPRPYHLLVCRYSQATTQKGAGHDPTWKTLYGLVGFLPNLTEIGLSSVHSDSLTPPSALPCICLSPDYQLPGLLTFKHISSSVSSLLNISSSKNSSS